VPLDIFSRLLSGEIQKRLGIFYVGERQVVPAFTIGLADIVQLFLLEGQTTEVS
jgi:hypothetical protein